MTRRPLVALAGLWLAICGAAAVWITVDRRPPEWDHANHLERAVLCAADLGDGSIRAILERSSFYPPLVTCAAGLAYRLFPSDTAAAQSVVLLFLGIAMGAVYLLGRSLASGTAGVVAALLFGSAPFIVFSSLRFQLDLPLAAMVAVATVTLLRTDRFRHRAWSVGAGIVLGLGLLTKPPFVVYVLPVSAWAVAGARTRRTVANAALALAGAAALGLPWYGPRIFGLPVQIANRSFKLAAGEGKAETFTWAGLGFYPTWLMNQFGVVATLLFCVGLVVIFRRRRWLLLSAILLPFGVFELIQGKDLRYALPLLPLVAVAAALGLTSLPPRLRPAAVVLLLGVGALQVTGTAFGAPRGLTIPLLGTPWVLESTPTRLDWRQREISRAIVRDSGGGSVTVSVVPNYDRFSVSNFRYYGLRDGLPLRFARAWDDAPFGVDYMILKTGDVGPSWTADRSRRVAERLAADPYLAGVFPVIGEFSLPDGSMASVRARRVPPDLDGSLADLAGAVEAAVRREIDGFARDVEGLRITLEYGQEIRRGRLSRVDVAAITATVGDYRRPRSPRLRLADVHIAIEDLLVNPLSAHAEQRLDPLAAGRLSIEGATIAAADLQSFVRAFKPFRRTTVRLDSGALDVVVEQPGPDVHARVRFVASGGRLFGLVAERVRIGGLRVPDRFANWIIRHYDPSPKLMSRLSVLVDPVDISVAPEGIRIGRRR